MTQAFGTGYSLAFGIESVAVLGLGASMAINGALTVGMLMAFISYKDEFSSRVQRFIDNMMGIRMLQLHAERLSDIVLANAEDLNSGPIGEPPLDQAPTLEVENLSFRYGDSLPWVLRNVSLKVAATEHVAIVGPTGCGKTTLAKILLGLLEPTEGTVRMNGVSLQQMGLSAWRRNVAAVMQDDQLFSGSLRDNIAGFDEDVQHAQIEHAARLASIHLEITAMPMGYHTLNGDMGSSLSGGQKQRVLLARALYRRPRILLLDEATSNLDVDKERSVNEAIRGLQATRITIAHRPETIASADRVIELVASAEH
jgi:ATP-binding cassette subfamily B protein RaxB